MRGQALLIALLMAACSADKPELHFECASPDGSMVATLFFVSGGDRPIDRETRLNVRHVGSELDSSMFSFAIRDGYDAVLYWESERKLIVDYPMDSTIRHMENVIFGSSQTFEPDSQILVSYEAKPSTHGYFMVEKRCYNASGK